MRGELGVVRRARPHEVVLGRREVQLRRKVSSWPERCPHETPMSNTNIQTATRAVERAEETGPATLMTRSRSLPFGSSSTASALSASASAGPSSTAIAPRAAYGCRVQLVRGEERDVSS